MSLEDTVSPEASTDLLDSFCNVDEKEAEDINSCLNFLSILDDEETTDSCNFTLFRKKDDKQSEMLDRNYKTCESKKFDTNNTKDVCNSAVIKASSSRGRISQAKIDINSDKSEDINIKSPNSSFKSGAILSPILVPVKKADSSFIKTKSNIILKIPSLSPKYSPSEQKDPLQIDRPKLSQNINCTEFKILKKLKFKTITRNEREHENSLKNVRTTLQYVKDGEVLLKKRIILPSVSAARKPVIPTVEPISNNILKTLPSTVKQYGTEEKSEFDNHEKNSEDACNLKSADLLSTCSYDEEKTGNDLKLKYSDTLSHNINSENKMIINPEYDNTLSISNSVKIAEPETTETASRNSAEIQYPECENEINIQEKECENEIRIQEKENKEDIIWEKECANEINIQEKQCENEKSILERESETEISVQSESEISIQEKQCENEKSILEEEYQKERRFQENECENEVNVQETLIEVPQIEFKNKVNVQDSLEISYSELEEIDDIHNIQNFEPEISKHSNENQNSNIKQVTFFNSFSSIEITQSSIEESSKEKLMKSNVKTRIIAPSKRRKKTKMQTNSNKTINKINLREAATSLNRKILKNKSKCKEMYKPLKRMELPTFLKHNLQGKKDLKEIKVSESINKESSPSNVGKETDVEKSEDSLVIDEASCTSSLNSDHTSDSLFILKESYSDSSCKTSTCEMIDKIHNYCHSSRLITNENSTNSSSANDNSLNSLINNDNKLEMEGFKTRSTEAKNIFDSLTGNADHVSFQLLDNSQFNEHMFLCDNETPNDIRKPEFPPVDFNEISKTLITNEESTDQAGQSLVDCNEISKTLTTNEKRTDQTGQSFCIPNSETSKPCEEKVFYSYNKSSPLSFTVQNVLENMFKYESFPSSANMARLAKVLGIHWKSIRNWFVARRTLNKKNGIFLRNKTLTSCPYCPNANDVGNDKAIVHLLSKEHIQNMVVSVKKHNRLFTEVHEKICEHLGMESSKVKIDLSKEQKKLKKLKEIKKNSTKNAEMKSLSNGECLISNGKCNNKVKVDDDNNKLKIDKAQINGEAAVLTTKNNTARRLPSDYVKIIDGVGSLISKDKPASNISINRSPVNETRKEMQNPVECLKSKDGNLIKKYRENSNEEYPLKMDGNSMLKMGFDSKLVLGYRCPDCFKIFNTEWMLIKHSLLHKKFICDECKEVFSMEEQLKYHFKEHLIESMDDDLYRYYVCFRCFNLNCICSQETYEIPFFGEKHYIRPQKARRSKPFRSVPYSGANEHLKVTWGEFWNIYKKKQISSSYDSESPKLLNKEKLLTKLDSKKIGNKICSAPTYTNITTFNCYICESFFFTHDELEEHLTVHKIQANNKRRKKSKDVEENKKSKKLKVEDNAPELKKSMCYYCNKSFKTRNLLLKHFKFFCKSLPIEINPKNTLNVERIGKSNKFKLKTEQSAIKTFTNSSKPSTMIKCELCAVELPPDKVVSHRRICTGQLKVKYSDKLITTDLNDYHYWEGTEKGLYLCKFCNIPLESPSLIIMHIGGSCSKAPREVVSEINHTTYRSKEHDHSKYYKLIKRADFDKIIPLEKIQLMLDLSSFISVHGQDKRFRCKFCEKYPYKPFLRLHLTKHCKYVPKELRNIIRLHQNTIFSTTKITEDRSSRPIEAPDSDSHGNELSVDLSLKSVVKSSKYELELPSHETLVSSVIFYDCHLCEKKFRFSKDFITHMKNIHCMNISEKSCYKWLSKVGKNERDPDLEKTSPDISYDQQEEDSLLTLDLIGSEIIEESVTEIDLSKEVTIESLADESIIEETVTESDLKEDTIESLNNETESDDQCSILTATPNKGQKLDDELLNEDFEQFGNFIETVQLEDSAFANASS